jgi:adenine/guanine/hypoxanthine permease
MGSASVACDCRIPWFRSGDLNGFLGLLADNMATLSFIVGILIGAFQFPAEVVFKYMVPGTAFGVFLGDAAFSLLGRRLQKKHGRDDIAAMPLGLDTPSAIGLAVTVIGPAFIAMKSSGVEPYQAAINAWYIGMAAVISIGALKIAFVPFANTLQKIIPKAALLGSLAGICIILIGFMPLVEIFTLPIVGIISLGIVLYTLIAKIDLPYKLPGAFVAIVIGTVIYHVLGLSGFSTGTYAEPSLNLYFGLPLPRAGFIQGFESLLKYIPIIIPFSILVVIGDLNIAESAMVGGDPYEPKTVLFIDGLCTMIGGMFGAISQTTAYPGQSAYKKMGSRTGYTLLAALFIGLGGVFGYISFFVELIPTAVLAPILIFVGLEITSQAFTACHARYAPAVCFAILPSVARYVNLQFTNPEYISADKLTALVNQTGQTLPHILVIIALSGGFILVGMLWGAFFAEMIDRRLKRSSVYCFILAVLTFFGIVHSVDLSGQIYLPWTLTGIQQSLVYNFTIGYMILGLMLFALSFTKAAKNVNGVIPEAEEAFF